MCYYEDEISSPVTPMRVDRDNRFILDIPIDSAQFSDNFEFEETAMHARRHRSEP